MSSLKLSVALCAIVFCFVTVNGDEEMKKKAMKCDGQDMKMMGDKGCMEGMKACWKKYAGEGEDKKAQMEKIKGNTCFQVCILQNKHVLDSNGCFNETGITEMAPKVYPTQEHADKMIEGLKACAKESDFDSTKHLSMDDNCKAYEPFKMCMMKKHKEVCKIETDDFPGM